MTEISISLSGLTGVDWPRWQGQASEGGSSNCWPRLYRPNFRAEWMMRWPDSGNRPDGQGRSINFVADSRNRA